ncbi:MAG: WD40 repeat domain-containing protein [Planctomycetota bacterium]|jgi:WD40 repeat protein
MRGLIITAAAVLHATSSALANHDRLSLDQKIRASDLVVVGTVSAIDEKPDGGSSFDPAETATRFATISIEKVLHGEAEHTIKVGYRTEYDHENDVYVRSVAFSPDGKLLAMAGGGRLLRLWNVATGKEELTLFGHHDVVNSVAFSRDGAKLASAGGESMSGGELKIWDLPTGAKLRSMITERSVRDATFTPDGNAVLLGGEGRLMLWNLLDGKVQPLYEGYVPSVRCSTISNNGKLIASGGSRHIVIRNSSSGEELFNLDGFTNYASSVSFAPDGSRLAAAGGAYMDTGLVKVWSTDDGQQVLSFHIQDECSRTTKCNVSDVAFSPDGKQLATSGGSDFAVRVWDASSARELHVFRGHEDSVLSIAWSPDGKLLASGSLDRTAKIWNVEDGALSQTLCADETFVKGEQYVLFLRKLSRPYMAIVNWQYGGSHVSRGALNDPRWPSHDASRTKRYNKSRGDAEPDLAPNFKRRIPFDEALLTIQDAVAIAEAQVQLGKIDIDGDLAPVLYEAASDNQRVYVRFPHHVACPDFDLQRLECVLKAQTWTQQPRGRPKTSTAPASVDPLKTTTQVVFTFPLAPPRDLPQSVVLTLDGVEKTLCLRQERHNGCSSDSVVRKCRACGSFETVPMGYGLYMPSQDPCKSSKIGRRHLGGCIVRSQQWHCNACGIEW